MPESGSPVIATEGDAVRFTASIVDFVRRLRGVGVAVSPAQSADLLSALQLVDVLSRNDVYAACRCLLVKRHDDLPVFDMVFAMFWRSPDPNEEGDITAPPNGRTESSSQPPDEPRSADVDGGMERAGDLGDGDVEGSDESPSEPESGESEVTGLSHLNDDDVDIEDLEQDEVFTYSHAEALWDKSLSALTGSELAEAERLLAEADWALPTRRTRRTSPSSRGRTLDQRRMAREVIRMGGETFQLHWRTPRVVTRPLVFIADGSGSMEPYTKILLRFAHVLRRRYAKAEAFVFSTQLTRITRDVDAVGPDAALRRVAEHVTDLAGGTRIGDALHTFNRVWSRRVLGRGSIVVIVSDGWDQGDLELLEHEIAHLQRNCYRLVWMNPLSGLAGYVPRAAGMTTALPYVDDFMPGHNLASLRVLVTHLEALESTRPVRSQSAAMKVS